MMAKFIEQSDGGVEVLFTVSAPMSVYEDFINLSKQEYGNCYWIAIKDMMESKKRSIEYSSVITRLTDIENKLGQIEESEEQFKLEERTLGM